MKKTDKTTVTQLVKITFDAVISQTRLLAQVICRTVEWGGTFREIRRGISRG